MDDRSREELLALLQERDAVIAVHLTAKFSGTYFSSCRAAETISRARGKPIHVIDSKNVSGALGLIVLRIAQAIEKGSALDTGQFQRGSL